MKTVRLGILGAGGIVRYGHLPALVHLKEVQVTAICDPRIERARQIAAEYGITGIHKNAGEILQNPEIDAVLVAVPNAFHAPLTVKALNAGKHVFCEKPPALNAAEARKMLDAAQKNKRALLFAFNQRHNDRSKALKQIMESGKLGDVYYARASWIRRRMIPGLGTWFTDRKLSGGGPLIDIGVHVLDLALWFCGYPKVKSVSGATFHQLGKKIARTDLGAAGARKMQVEDLATAYIRFENGAVLFLETSFALHTLAQETISIDLHGVEAGAQWRLPLDVLQPPLMIVGEENGRTYDCKPQVREKESWRSYYKENAEFVQCISNPARSWQSAADGVTLMKVIDAIYESARKGREVAIRER